MKVIVILAILALALAAEEKKPAEKPAEKPIEKPDEKKQDEKKQDEKKPEEKKDDEHRGLQWPLPDWRDEGDLIQHGVHLYQRVAELKKQKSDDENDKVILDHGRNFLRRAHKYLEATPDFKIFPVICHDMRNLNATHRWEIRRQDQPAQPEQQGEKQQEKQPEKEKAQPQNDAPAKTPTQNDQPSHPKDVRPRPDDKPAAGNASHENVTEAPIAKPDREDKDNWEARRADHYRRLGDNFARLLSKRYRKENLIAEETEYLEHWHNDEAVHYGVLGIYCHDGENVKEIVKKINGLVEEK